jgi:hypothetical protein
MEKKFTSPNHSESAKLIREKYNNNSYGKGLPRSNTIGRKEPYPLRTLNLLTPNIKTSHINKYPNKGIPLTTPDRSASNQNIFNIIFNNSNVNIQNTQNVNINNNYVVINSDDKSPIILQNIISQTDGKVKPGGRVDRNGIAITKTGRKHCISFMDRINNKRLVDLIEVESYKAYNHANSYRDNKNASCSLSCCHIF